MRFTPFDPSGRTGSILLHATALIVLVILQGSQPKPPDTVAIRIIAGSDEPIIEDAPAVPAPATPPDEGPDPRPEPTPEPPPVAVPAQDPTPEPVTAPEPVEPVMSTETPPPAPTTESGPRPTAPREIERVEEAPSRADREPREPGDGEAVASSDGLEFPFPEYLANLQKEIRRHFRPPARGTGTVSVQFTIDRAGSVTRLAYVQRSGNPLLDIAGMAAIEEAGHRQRFGPLPAAYGPDRLTIVFDFEPASR